MEIVNKISFGNMFSVREVSDKYKNKYPNFSEDVIADIQYYTESLNEILTDELAMKDATELEEYRKFKNGFLREKGIFYSEGDKTLTRFPKMVKTSYLLHSDTFKERYMLPIKLFNGDIFTWVGYDPSSDDFKYRFPTTSSINAFVIEGNLLGNLESINQYKHKIIFVCEGLFDAYRVNEYLKYPSISLLGSKLTKNKKLILEYIKNSGYKFIYLPDFDKAGLSKYLIENKLWDRVVDYRNKSTLDVKDFDEHVMRIYKLGLEESDNIFNYLS